MKWYWIVLLVLAYLIIGAVCAGIVARLTWDDDETMAMVMVLLWPIFFPLALVVTLLEFIYELFL